MIKINLLPLEYEASLVQKEQKILAGSVIAVLVILLSAIWMIKSKEEKNLKIQIAQAEADLSRYQAIVSQIESIELQKTQLEAKRGAIRNLNKSRLVYPVFFEDFLPIIPTEVWMGNINIQDQGAPGSPMRISLTCNAISNFAVATFLSNLQQSTHFSAVELGPISYANNAETGTSVLSFNISCVYQHQGPFPLAEFN
ncbi:MAG: PilN domain-containing protein [Elusimicrobiota bacterium]